MVTQTLGLSLKGMKQKGLVSCVLCRFLHLLKTDFNFYVVLTYIKKLHNIYLKALHMNRARWATRPAWRTEGNELNQLKVKINQKPCYITVFEKPSILFLNNVVSALLLLKTNRQEQKERKILIKTLVYWELRAKKVCLTAV